MQIFTFKLTFIVLLWHHKSKSYSEKIEEVGCHNTEFRISCGSLNAHIAIFEAIFFSNDSFIEFTRISCGSPGKPIQKNNWKIYKIKQHESFFHQKSNSSKISEISFRHAINRRCSGVNYCSFVFSEDVEAASSLGPGAVYLRYECVDDFRLTNVCNSSVEVTTEGFVKTPGYPNYYIGETTCTWNLKAFPPQRIKLAFLDVSLRVIAPLESGCLDWLIVTEDGLNLLSTCGDIIEDTSILSDGSSLNVSFKSTSKTLFPKRGFLFHYKAVGCPSLRKPRDGYLINKNETFAHFRCCIGFVFPDSLSRDKKLKCHNENTWDSVIIDCVNVTELLREKNNSYELIENLSVESRETMETADLFKDIIVPSIIICVLFIGNGIVLYFIYIKKKKLESTEKIEMKEISNGRVDA